MKKIYDGNFWECHIDNALQGMKYKYRIYDRNGNFLDHCDPYGFYADLRPEASSIIYGLSNYCFSDKKYLNRRKSTEQRPVNIYEIHAGSWKKPEDHERPFYSYRELADLLIPYLTENHYNFAELMPLHEYPCDESWGYQATGFFSPTSRYGTPDDLRYFIDRCHEENIGVILDFVPVHFAVNDYGLLKYDGTALYEYPHSDIGINEWGSCNFMHSRGEVRSFLQSSAYYWLREFHFDGLRVDAVSNLIYWQGDKERGENPSAIRFIQTMNAGLKKRCPEGILIAEDSTVYPGVTAKVSEGGLGFDYKWDLGWMNDTLKYFEKDPVYRKWHHNQITFSMAYFYSERFILPFSHDEVVHGKKTIIDKLWGSYEQKFQQLRTLYTYMFTHPGKKLNFMGNELAMFREWDEAKENDWFMLTYPAHDSFNRYFKELTKLYTSKKPLYENDYSWDSFKWIDADNADQNLFSYIRKSDTSDLVVILNMSPNLYEKHKFGVEHNGTYKEILNSEQDIYGGCNITNPDKIKAVKEECNFLPYTIEVTVPPFGAVILETRKRSKKK